MADLLFAWIAIYQTSKCVVFVLCSKATEFKPSPTEYQPNSNRVTQLLPTFDSIDAKSYFTFESDRIIERVNV